jgi:ABC-type sugar transport system permease subunit
MGVASAIAVIIVLLAVGFSVVRLRVLRHVA